MADPQTIYFNAAQESTLPQGRLWPDLQSLRNSKLLFQLLGIVSLLSSNLLKLHSKQQSFKIWDNQTPAMEVRYVKYSVFG